MKFQNNNQLWIDLIGTSILIRLAGDAYVGIVDGVAIDEDVKGAGKQHPFIALKDAYMLGEISSCNQVAEENLLENLKKLDRVLWVNTFLCSEYPTYMTEDQVLQIFSSK